MAASISASASGESHLAGPASEASAQPSRLTMKVVGKPKTSPLDFSSLKARISGSRRSTSDVAPMSLRKRVGLSRPPTSTLSATTEKSARPRFSCSACRCGISVRQGTHQVAHMLTTSVWPARSETRRSPPSGVWRTRLEKSAGASAGNRAEKSPVANVLNAAARGTALAQRPPLSTAPLSVTYTAARPAATATIAIAAKTWREGLNGIDRSSFLEWTQ